MENCRTYIRAYSPPLYWNYFAQVALAGNFVPPKLSPAIVHHQNPDHRSRTGTDAELWNAQLASNQGRKLARIPSRTMANAPLLPQLAQGAYQLFPPRRESFPGTLKPPLACNDWRVSPRGPSPEISDSSNARDHSSPAFATLHFHRFAPASLTKRTALRTIRKFRREYCRTAVRDTNGPPVFSFADGSRGVASISSTVLYRGLGPSFTHHAPAISYHHHFHSASSSRGSRVVIRGRQVILVESWTGDCLCSTTVPHLPSLILVGTPSWPPVPLSKCR